MKRIEEQHQAAYFQWARLQAKSDPRLKWVHASMNGASASSPASAGRRKALGQTKGVADIFLPYPSGGYHGLYIELKIKPNRLTPEQKDFLADMRAVGYLAVVAWDWEEAKAITLEYLTGVSGRPAVLPNIEDV